MATHPVGQAQEPTRLKAGSARLRRLIIPVVMATVLSSIGIAVVLRQGDGGSPATAGRQAGPAAARRVVWEVTSTPSAVEVVRVSDGVVLGKTPWRQLEPAGGGKVGLTLRHTGYLDKQVLLDQAKDCKEEVVLDPIPAAQEPASADTAEKPSTHSTRKTGRTKKNKEAPKNDDDLDLAPLE